MKTKFAFASIAVLLAVFVSACAGVAPELPSVNGDTQTTILAQPQQEAGNGNPLGNAPGQGGPGGRLNLEAAAQALGVTVEELQAALQNARPAECLAPGEGQPPERVDCRPDFEAAASALGVTVEEFQSALRGTGDGRGKRDLTAAAEALGVTVEQLQQALQDARPAECPAPGEGQPAQGVDCRADLDAAAASLGVTTEELREALEIGNRGRDFAAAAEALGVTEEQLRQALQDAKLEGCVEGERPSEGVDCRPDLEAVAASLGVTTEELQTALQETFQGGPGKGGRPHDGPGGNGQQPPQG